MTALTEADIVAARAQGDLTSLLLMASGLPVTATSKARVRTGTPVPPRARPGAWPDGTQSPRLTPAVAAHMARLWPDRFPLIEEDR
ncbi:hypothetical protein [Streptomyces sp. NPDC059759]|uniref:hypothetical protein n=1 Tax=Streptomyces sp. NPDC059759 TaxID=3346936 RepID=UPI003661FF33